MTPNVSRRSLLALGAGLGASAMLGETALAKAPKVGTQPAYFYRFGLGDAEVTVVSDGQLGAMALANSRSLDEAEGGG